LDSFAICADAHRPRAERCLNHTLERQIVGILVEKRSATHATVQDVKDHPARRVASVLAISPSFVNFGGCHHLQSSAAITAEKVQF
jgi:hypothetical protein